MTDHDRLIEQIDACRSGSDDLASPEFADLAARLREDPKARRLYDRVQALDAKFTAALHDVAVPAGLHSRLTAAIAREAATTDALPANAARPSGTGDRADRAVVSPGWWLWAGGGLVATAAAVLVAWTFLHTPAEISPDELLGWGIDKFDEAEPERALVLLPGDRPELPLSNFIDRDACGEIRWWTAGRYHGHKVVEFALGGIRGQRARLIALKATGSPVARPLGVRVSSPYWPPPATPGIVRASWSETVDGMNVVYVLVVEGDDEDYRDLLLPEGPTAQVRPPSPLMLAAAHRSGALQSAELANSA